MALSVPLSRFTSRVGGGSAFFVRQLCTRMKKCTYCGRKYPDETVACAIDQQSLELCQATSTFGRLSVWAPFIGALLFYILYCVCEQLIVVLLYIPPLAFLVVSLPSLLGIIFAIVSWKRSEPSRGLRWFGLILNVGILFLFLIGSTRSHGSSS